jgi:hypothetical protein
MIGIIKAIYVNWRVIINKIFDIWGVSDFKWEFPSQIRKWQKIMENWFLDFL